MHFSHTLGYQSGKKVGKIPVYIFSVISLHRAYHIQSISLHILYIFPHNKGKGVVHIMSYHHVISGYFISTTVDMKADTTDLNMILYRKH